MTFFEYALFSFGSLFIIIDPIAAVPAFLAMTARESVRDRLRTARTACIVAVGIIAGFGFMGPSLFHILGITMPAFQIAAALVLLVSGCGEAIGAGGAATEGSGKIVEEKRTVAAFRMLAAHHGIEVVIKDASIDSLTVEADDNLLPLVETKVENDVAGAPYGALDNAQPNPGHSRRQATIQCERHE